MTFKFSTVRRQFGDCSPRPFAAAVPRCRGVGLLRDEFLLRFGIVVTAGSGHGLMVSSS